jgi:hypothetical protein
MAFTVCLLLALLIDLLQLPAIAYQRRQLTSESFTQEHRAALSAANDRSQDGN